MKKYLLLIITLMVIGMSSASAQVVWGARIGLSKPTMTSSEGDNWDGKFGLELGPVLYYSLKSNWYLNSGVQVSFKKFSDSYEGFNFDYQFIGVDIPVYAGYAFKLGKVSLYAQTGPYMTIKLSEKEKWSYDGESGSESSDEIKTINAGLGVMLGVNIHRFKIEAGYQFGLTNIWKEDYGFTSRINSLFLGVSYVF